MSQGLLLWLGLVIVCAFAASRVNTGPAKACDQHTWKWNDDQSEYQCEVCELVARAN